jgi:EpsI family protein
MMIDPAPQGELTARRSALLAGVAMVAAAGAGGGLRLAAQGDRRRGGPPYLLSEVVPRAFGHWSELPNTAAQVVNPQTQELLDKLYSQLLARTYAHKDGYRIMLSMAYGDDQRGGLQAHKPEVCYPALGFTLHSSVEAGIVTPFGTIPGRRLMTSLGVRREPISYWFTAGDTAVTSRMQLRLLEARLWLTGQIPDGLLFRVSSIDDDAQRAWQWQERFVAELMAALSAQDRRRIGGLQAAAGAARAS